MKAEPGSILISDMTGRMGDMVWQKRRKGAGIRSTGRILANHPRKKHGSVFQVQCDCSAWQECDRLYMEMQIPVRQVWKEAIKAPNTTAYTLFMKECVSLTTSGLFAPDFPGPSGGYTTGEAIEGDTNPPPNICLPPVPPLPIVCPNNCSTCAQNYTGVISGMQSKPDHDPFGDCLQMNGTFEFTKLNGDPDRCSWKMEPQIGGLICLPLLTVEIVVFIFLDVTTFEANSEFGCPDQVSYSLVSNDCINGMLDMF